LEKRCVPVVYVSEVEKPRPPASSYGVIKKLSEGGESERRFLVYLDELSMSWDMLREDRRKARVAMEGSDGD
jgi:hypothetical protein